MLWGIRPQVSHSSTTSVQVSGWPALLVPVVVVLLLGLLIDSVSASRR